MTIKVESLYPKIKILKNFYDAETIANAMGVTESAISKWGKSGERIRQKNASSLCEFLEIDIGIFVGPKDKYITTMADKFNIPIENLEKIWAEHDHLNLNFPFFKRTFHSINPERMHNIYDILHGYYYGYCYWIDLNKDPSEIIIKMLVNIYEYDQHYNIFRVRVLSTPINRLLKKYDVAWDYAGIVVCFEKQLACIVEFVVPKPDWHEIFWVIANMPEEDDDGLIYGILSAGIRETSFSKPYPSATRLILKKINDYSSVASLQQCASRAISANDIDQEDARIAFYISNKVDSDTLILSNSRIKLDKLIQIKKE